MSVWSALLAIGPAALADDPDRESWVLLEDALLVESVDGDLAGAARAYEQIVRNHPVEDPSRGEALFALGRVRSQLGQLDLAREALLEGIRTGSCLDRCQSMLGGIELDQESIGALPVRWTFDDPAHGFFHPWQFDHKGTIRLAREGGDGSNTVLEWRTTVDVREGDQLVVGFRHPQPAPARVSFRARSVGNDAWLQIVVIDHLGRAYSLPMGATSLPVERWVELAVDLEQVHPVDPLDPLLDPARITRVQIRDVSAIEGAPLGPNVLWIDDFAVE